MIGRREETKTLNELFDSRESEFVAIYGRRRVGKTYLVRETFEGRFSFRHTGLPNVVKARQLDHFFLSLKEAGCAERRKPANWFAAFDLLKTTLANRPEARKVVFIDEMPWMDTPKSDFLPALESFWNEWASARKDILLIVCGSASAWIVKKIFRNRGALHNRVTARILLRPFSLGECELYAAERGLSMTRADIAECYMALGGIPYYWRLLERGRGVPGNFDHLFFAENAPLRGEFDELYASLFKDSANHRRIVKALAERKSGLTRSDIAKASGLRESGKLTETLEALEQSGFIRTYRAFGKKKRDAFYQLTDDFTLFHFQFLDGKTSDPSFWESTSSSPMQSAWRGLAFERLCLQHLAQMRRALGISGIHVEAWAWRHVADDVYPTGVQIDLVLDRSDNVIDLFEMKWSRGPFTLDGKTADELALKAETFRAVTGTRKAVHVAMATTAGLVRNAYRGAVQSEITLDDLFAE